MTKPDHELLDKITAEAEHAEATRDAPLPYQRRRKTGAQSVYGLRLPVERIEQLQRLAQARGIEPSVLARQWVIDQLDRAESGTPEPGEARWERDLRATTEHLRKLLDERPSA
jgi:aryl-alcohol dehydrogenase-like predicted oxidoreductase